MNQPLVSIIITNYNYDKYIGEAINSALAQTYENIEIIIIDDGSDDNSRGIIQRYVDKNPQIRFYKQKNKGIVLTRNRGIKLANGEFIYFLDSDNIMLSNCLEKLVKQAVRKKLDVVYTDLKQFGIHSGMANLPEFDIEILKYKNIVDTATLIRKVAIKDYGFDEYLNRLSHEDWDFFLGLALKGCNIAKNNETYIMYRVHKDSRNRSVKDSGREGSLRFIKMYFYVINKYKKLYPGEIDFSENCELVDWNIESHKRAYENEKLGVIIKNNEKRIEDLEKEISEIFNSKSYKLGQIITAPYRIFKKGKDE